MLRPTVILAACFAALAARADELPAFSGTTEVPATAEVAAPPPAPVAPPAPRRAAPAPVPVPPAATRLNAITVSPIGLLLGAMGAGSVEGRFDRVIADNIGVAAQVWYRRADAAGVLDGETFVSRTNNLEGALSAILHLGDRPFNGFWVGGGITGGKLDDTTDMLGVLTIQKGNVYGIRLQGGYDMLWDNGVVFGFFGGVGFQTFKGQSTSTKPDERPAPDASLDYNGLMRLGYAF